MNTKPIISNIKVPLSYYLVNTEHTDTHTHTHTHTQTQTKVRL